MNDFPWITVGRIRCCGFAHTPESKFLSGEGLADYFAKAATEQELVDLLKVANGCFALILPLNQCLYAAVDRIRSIPLFYLDKPLPDPGANPESLICGHAHDLGTPGPAIEPDILAEYLMTGYVTGADTLIPEVKQLQAGHYLKWEVEKHPVQSPYYRYLHETRDDEPLPELLARLDQIHLQVAHRLADSLSGRTAVVPLSGGYDSRLVAWLLKRIGYPSIICFTYGATGNPESEISRRVAQALGLRWIFTPHNRQLWHAAYQSLDRKKYYALACNAVSSAHIQDWLSVKIMKEKRMIPEDAVFVPGHSADFLEGSHLPESFFRSPEISQAQLYEAIIRRHYSLWKDPSYQYQEGFSQRIDSILSSPDQLSNTEAASLFDHWDHRERQAKFIINSVRAYEFWDFSWRLPLWDHELVDFWTGIPLSYKHKRNLWHSYQTLYFPMQIPVFDTPPLVQRARDKFLRPGWGNINDIRYGRFAPFQNPIQYASVKVQSLLNQEFEYPAFVKPGKPLLKCDLNAIQALISLL